MLSTFLDINIKVLIAPVNSSLIVWKANFVKPQTTWSKRMMGEKKNNRTKTTRISRNMSIIV